MRSVECERGVAWMGPFDCAQDRLRAIQESTRQRKETEPALPLSVSVSRLCLSFPLLCWHEHDPRRFSL